ncbi:MAG TPA: LysR family transcriptional regulator [Candidatus Competibacteraceae bacterium]|nr:LysR family transcriptional regulator [Candidatus Competibacteraceae bacterium]
MKASLEQLQTFAAAARCGSFSAAARHLGKAQSAVSEAVQNLELDCGVSLFERSGRYPILTAAGRALLEEAEALLRRHAALLERAHALAAGVEPRLTLAIDAALPIAPFLATLGRFEAVFPHVQLELLSPTLGDVAELVRTGRAELGLMFEQEDYPQGLHFRGIGHLGLVAVAGAQHPLAALERVDVRQIAEQRQLLLTPRQPQSSRKRIVFSQPRWELESQAALLELVRAGLGWALLPQVLVEEDLRLGRLRRLELDFQPAQIIEGVDLLWTAARPLGPAGEWLLRALPSAAGADAAV